MPTAAYADSGERGIIGGNNRFGIGLQSGVVSGVSLKYFMSQRYALQVGVGGSPYGFGLNLEYLAHPFQLSRGGPVSVPFYFGLGLTIGTWESGYWGYGSDPANLNLHVPLGVAVEFHALPIDLFIQAEPGFALVPHFSPTLGGTLGARLFF